MNTNMKNIDGFQYEPISPIMSYDDNEIIDDRNKPFKKRKHNIALNEISSVGEKQNELNQKDIIYVHNGVIFFSKIIVIDDINTVDEAIKIITELEVSILPQIDYLQGIDKIMASQCTYDNSMLALLANEMRAINEYKESVSRSINYIKQIISLLINKEKIMKLFLDENYDPDRQFGPNQFTIIQYAMSYCHYDNAIKILNKYTRNINCVTSKGLSLLHLALYSVYPEINDDKYRIACYLIDNGINVNIKDKIWQSTALHIICGNKFTMRIANRLNLIDLIIKKNGDPTINNFLHHTPIDYAKNFQVIDSVLSELMLKCMKIEKYY